MTFFQKMPQDINAGDERPDRVGDHEWDDAVRVCVGEKSEGAQKIERVVPESARRHESPFVAGKCKECKKCRSDAEDFDWLHHPIIPCAGDRDRTCDLVLMKDSLLPLSYAGVIKTYYTLSLLSIRESYTSAPCCF